MRRKGASRSAVSRILCGPKIVEVDEVVDISQSVPGIARSEEENEAVGKREPICKT